MDKGMSVQELRPVIDILEKLAIPIAVVLIPLTWGFTGVLVRRWRFTKLIYHEIRELGPFPERRNAKEMQELRYTKWLQHFPKKVFIHKRILDRPVANRDFILSISPKLVYDLNQFWAAKETMDKVQFKHFLSELCDDIPWVFCSRKSEMIEIKCQWTALIASYEINQPPDVQT